MVLLCYWAYLDIPGNGNAALLSLDNGRRGNTTSNVPPLVRKTHSCPTCWLVRYARLCMVAHWVKAALGSTCRQHQPLPQYYKK